MPETVAWVLDLSMIVCYSFSPGMLVELVILAEKRWLADLPSWF